MEGEGVISEGVGFQSGFEYKEKFGKELLEEVELSALMYSAYADIFSCEGAARIFFVFFEKNFLFFVF